MSILCTCTLWMFYDICKAVYEMCCSLYIKLCRGEKDNTAHKDCCFWLMLACQLLKFIHANQWNVSSSSSVVEWHQLVNELHQLFVLMNQLLVFTQWIETHIYFTVLLQFSQNVVKCPHLDENRLTDLNLSVSLTLNLLSLAVCLFPSFPYLILYHLPFVFEHRPTHSQASMLLTQVNETDGRVGSMLGERSIACCDTGCHGSICVWGKAFSHVNLDFCCFICDGGGSVWQEEGWW